MLGKTSRFRYRLGIDVGVASLGIAVLAFEDTNQDEAGEPKLRWSQKIGQGVKVYSTG